MREKYRHKHTGDNKRDIISTSAEMRFIKEKMKEEQEMLDNSVPVDDNILEIFKLIKDVFRDKNIEYPPTIEDTHINFQLETFPWIAWRGGKAYKDKGDIYFSTENQEKVEIPQKLRQKSLDKIVSIFYKFLEKDENKGNKYLIKIAKEFPKLRDFRIDGDGKLTAQISKDGYVKVSIQHLEKYALTPEDIAFIILHELKHKVNGDLIPRILSEENEGRYDELKREVENFVFDILINSYLLKHIFGFRYPKGTERFYKECAGNEIFFLLMFPPVWVFNRKKKNTLNTITSSIAKHIKDELKISKMTKNNKVLVEKSSEWARRFVTLWEIIWRRSPTANFIYKGILALISELEGIPYFREFDKIEIEGIGTGMGKGGTLPGYSNEVDEKEVKVDTSREANKIYEAVKRALSKSENNVVPTESLVPDVSVLPFPSRKDLFLLLKGVWPVFFKYSMPGKEEDFMATRVYIDVSESFNDFIGFTIGLLTAVEELIAKDIYCFSNAVFPVRKEDLFKGKIATTGGTDFDCIAKHALEHGFKKILVITDGYANLSDELKEKLRKSIDVYVVLIGEGMKISSDIIDIAGRDKYGEKWWIYTGKRRPGELTDIITARMSGSPQSKQ